MRHRGDREEEKPLILIPCPVRSTVWARSFSISPLLLVRSGSAAPKPTGHSDPFLYLTLPDPRIEEPLPHLLLATAKKPLEPFLLLLPGLSRSQMLKPHVPSPSLAHGRWTQLKIPQNNAWPQESCEGLTARAAGAERMG